MNEIRAVPAEAVAKTEQTQALSQSYDNFEIATASAYAHAGEDLKQLKSAWKEIDALRKSLTKPLDHSKKKIMDFFREPLNRIKQAESKVSSAMIGWAKEQERIRKAEEERLREAQRKEAARLAKLAAKAEARGDREKASEFDSRAEDVGFAAPVAVPKTTKIAGLAMTEIWKYRVVDVSKIPRQYMIPNDKMLGQMARSSKGLFKVEGVEFYSEDSVRGTR